MESSTLTDVTVSVSDFSRENAGIIFKDIRDNGHEYLVLNNQQPTAVVLSIDTFLQQQKKIAMLENLMTQAENVHLLELAKNRENSESIDFLSFLQSEGISISEAEALMDDVQLE